MFFFLQIHAEKILVISRYVVRRQQSSSFSFLTLTLALRTTHRVRIVIWKESSSVCVSVGEKLLRLQNALLIHDGHRTQTKGDDVTRPCALDFLRVVKSSEACSSPSARAIITHTWTSVSTYCSGYPCDGACSARASRLPMFSRRGSEGKKYLRSFC